MGAAELYIDPDREPVVIVDNLNVKYRAYSTGRAVNKGGRTLLTRSTRGIRTVHALRGVSLVAYKNESIGIIGANGSGKSTLMRAITGLLTPASGAVYAASRPNLLGVGAALLPDLSGDRNIILGGLALGMTRKEVTESRDHVVDFTELQDFIDLPMRTYSSGMQARLKLAIATLQDHEILIIDEALNVGDARFRQRSEARIREIRDNAGTIFLVSHSMSSILNTCTRAIWIDKGRVMLDGGTEEVVAAYEATRPKKKPVPEKPKPEEPPTAGDPSSAKPNDSGEL